MAISTFAADQGAPTFGRGFFFGVLFRAALTGRFCRSAAFPSYARDMIFCTDAGDMRPVGCGTLGVRARSQPSTFDGVVCTVKANDAIVRFEISMFPIYMRRPREPSVFKRHAACFISYRRHRCRLPGAWLKTGCAQWSV